VKKLKRELEIAKQTATQERDQHLASIDELSKTVVTLNKVNETHISTIESQKARLGKLSRVYF